MRTGCGLRCDAGQLAAMTSMTSSHGRRGTGGTAGALSLTPSRTVSYGYPTGATAPRSAVRAPGTSTISLIADDATPMVVAVSRTALSASPVRSQSALVSCAVANAMQVVYRSSPGPGARPGVAPGAKSRAGPVRVTFGTA